MSLVEWTRHKRIKELERAVGHTWHDPTLLLRALTHDSFANKHRIESNQRLELLGDAVMELVVTETLMAYFPERDEGWLSSERARMVNTDALIRYAEALGLGGLMYLSGFQCTPKVAASAVEALVGAAFLDGRYPTARAVVNSFVTYPSLMGR